MKNLGMKIRDQLYFGQKEGSDEKTFLTKKLRNGLKLLHTKFHGDRIRIG